MANATGRSRDMEETMSWWWAQLATHPGRAVSTGSRPMNYRDVLVAAEVAGLGEGQIYYLYLYGSWEESRGALAARWGTGDGPVRVLPAGLRKANPARRAAIWARHLALEAGFAAQGGAVDRQHRASLRLAWASSCTALEPATRASLAQSTPEPIRADITACP